MLEMIFTKEKSHLSANELESKQFAKLLSFRAWNEVIWKISSTGDSDKKAWYAKFTKLFTELLSNSNFLQLHGNKPGHMNKLTVKLFVFKCHLFKLTGPKLIFAIVGDIY